MSVPFFECCEFWIEVHSYVTCSYFIKFLVMEQVIITGLYNKKGKKILLLCCPLSVLFLSCLCVFFRSRVCKCDEECSDFGDCCFDWARIHFNKTKFIHSAQTREFQCKNWFSDVSLKLDLFSIQSIYISS